MVKKQISRKKFIQTATAGALLANLGVLSAQTGNTSTNLGSERKLLEEAGPMLPPVPAILLTVNGMENDKDEISVV